MNQKLYGVLFALAAFTAWGFLPAYWKQMQAVSAFEILCHRIVWSCIFLMVIISFQKRWKEVGRLIKKPEKLKGLMLSGFLIGAGVVTSLPLLWFAAAVKRLNLSTIGILQYLAPSIAFILGVFIYKEAFNRHSLITFAFIWIGVLLYTWESLMESQRQ